MTHDKYFILIDKLSEKSKEGSLDWEMTASQSSFQTTVAGYVLRISEQQNRNDDDAEAVPDYALSLYNSQGYLIESVSDPELSKSNRTFGAYGKMREIFKIARRSALGADKAVDSVIKGLDEIIPF